MDDPIELLAWDSKFFGKQVGRLNIQTSNPLDELLRLADQKEYRVLYIYSPSPIKETSIGSFALLDVGGHITFHKDLSSLPLKNSRHRPEIEEYQHDSPTPELLEIAFLSGNLSRFRIDRFLPIGSFEKLYATWLAKTLKKRPKAAVYTYQKQGVVAGLISAEWDEAKCAIGLLAVLPLFQGLGIATELINGIQEVCVDHGVKIIEVKTQLANTGARALYVKNSFTEKDRSFLYHAHRLE